MGYNKKGYYVRVKNIQKLTAEHYEPENNAKCYKMVWKKYIFPLYGIGYRTYLKYVQIKIEE